MSDLTALLWLRAELRLKIVRAAFMSLTWKGPKNKSKCLKINKKPPTQLNVIRESYNDYETQQRGKQYDKKKKMTSEGSKINLSNPEAGSEIKQGAQCDWGKHEAINHAERWWHIGGLLAVSPANCQLLIEQVLLRLWVCCNGIITQQRPNSSVSLWGSCQKSVVQYDMFH